MQKFAQKLAVGMTSLMMLSSVVATTPVYAQTTSEIFGLDAGEELGLGSRDLRAIINNVILTLMGFLGTVAVVIILYGGFIWMTASGNEEKVKKAQKLIIAGCIGLVIILSAYAIVVFVVNEIVKGTGAGETL